MPAFPSLECIQCELASATDLNDFFGKDGTFARLFASTVEQTLEAELTAHSGPPYAPEGRNSGNSRNGKRTRSLRTSNGDTTIVVPRDRNGTFEPALVEPYQSSTSELEDKIIGLYAKGMSTRDIQETLTLWRGGFSRNHQHNDRQGLEPGRGLAEPTAGIAVSNRLSRRDPPQVAARRPGADDRSVCRVGD